MCPGGHAKQITEVAENCNNETAEGAEGAEEKTEQQKNSNFFRSFFLSHFGVRKRRN